MSLQALCQNLREIIDVNQQIYQLATSKKEVLIVGNIDALAKIVQRESDLIKSMSALEAGRQQLVNDLILQYGISQNDSVKLSDLLAVIPSSSQKEELSSLFIELSALLTELHILNELNQQLIENSLQFVNYSIELFTEMPDEQVYQKPVAQDSGTYSYRRSIFDTKA